MHCWSLDETTHLMPGEQHDSHEFILFIFDRFFGSISLRYIKALLLPVMWPV